MSKTDRIFELNRLLRLKGSMTKQQVMEKFEIAEATFKRDLELLRDRFGADIQYDSQDKVYRLVSSSPTPSGAQPGGDKTEVPGLWFNEQELHSLLTLYELLKGHGGQGVVGEALGVARGNVMTMRSRPSGWTDRRRGARDAAADLEVIDEIKTVIEAQPSYGYIRVWGMVRNRRHAEGQGAINRKRIHRIMRENNLLLPQRHRAKNNTRAHDGRVAVDRSDTRWCSDGFEIKCWNNEKVRVAFVQDCCDREAISWVATTKGIDGVLVQDMLVVAVEQRFGSLLAAPRQIEFLTDNGSCYTDKRVRKHAGKMNLKPVRTPIESPQSNGMAESFVKTFKRDYVAFGDLTDAKTALEQLPKWFEHYNSLHPHSALKYLSPKMFRKHQLTNTDCPGKQG